MLADPEPEVACLREILLPQLVFLDFQTAFQDLLRLRAPDGDVDGDLLVAADAEGTDGVAGFACGDGRIEIVSSMDPSKGGKPEIP